jgi:hypothetical protein
LQIAAPVQAAVDDEFFFFPAAGYTWRSEDPAGHLKKHTGEAGLGLFYTAEKNNMRLLAEIFGKINGESEVEIERLQLSWKLGDRARLWLGRYHNPIGDWNAEYHHGTFLQTSISRPGIVEFEHEGGVLPVHIVGALLEGYTTHAGSVWRYDIAIGAGPELNEELKPVAVRKPGGGSHDIAITARLAWQPADSIDQLGIFAAFNQLPGSVITPIDVRQQLAGLFATWHYGIYTEILAAAYFLNNELSTTSGITTPESFRNGYVQLGQVLGVDWTAYGRIEGSAGDTGDTYLNLFGGFVRERQLIGLRYEIASNQAVKFEISKIVLLGEKFDQMDMQWSAVYP